MEVGHRREPLRCRTFGLAGNPHGHPQAVTVLHGGTELRSAESDLGSVADAVVPMGGTVLESNILSEDGHALTAMILTLWNELARARMPAFKLGRYVEHEQLGLHWHLRSNHVFGAKAGDGHCNHEAAKAEV
ncbi:hypothetical protein EIW28_09930 [Glycomyces terrestris]|uniref:Uncharacterized protein n=1 Tax=Glycomyces terrestris TaxID=2493553 RepID=A0A426V1Y7_9ACTN|nr:hypothetical protein EIW28_09930 [Glycomyces terrestris]